MVRQRTDVPAERGEAAVDAGCPGAAQALRDRSLRPLQEKSMSHTQRGNKEAKKPKKVKVQPPPAGPGLTPLVVAVPPAPRRRK